MPKVAVILSVFNGRRYVTPAVQSILAQSFDDFEFVIIDDGSTDGVTDDLRALASGDRRVRLTVRENRGYTLSLCEAIDHSTAPLVARMDADDISLPDRLRAQVNRFDAEPGLVLLGGAYELIDGDDRPIRTFRPPAEHAALDTECLAGTNPFCHPLVMFRRDAYRRVGGYDVTYEPAEDLDLWLKLAEIGSVAALPEVLLQYRQHAGSVSAMRQTRQVDRMREACAAACARRGLPDRPFSGKPWRPTDADGEYRTLLQYGWWAFNAGHRATARHYGWTAVRRRPWDTGAWKLWACATARTPGASLGAAGEGAGA